MDNFAQIARDLWIRWQALSYARKTAMFVGGAFCLSFAVMLWWVAQPEYRVLYTGLSAEEAGAITTKLQAKNVPYKLGSGGTTILVPAEQAMQVHLDLSIDGTPGSAKIGKGFELFSEPMLGATPFTQNVNFMRAQQAEIAKSIMQIDPILFARVHIVRPEPSPFIREQKPTTAAVMVKLRPGTTLKRNTITAITSFVSGSVEGLPRENVSIIDANGRPLSEHRDPETGMMGSFIEQRKEVEHYLASEAERLLDYALGGTGRAIVRVTAELNTKQMREKKEIINVDGKVARNEKITTNKTISNGGAGKGGAAGSSSNLGRGTSGTGTGGGGSSTNTETTQFDYDYPRTWVEWQNKQGAIDRLTIAAFVDTTGADGKPLLSIADVQETIKKAIGFKADRDEIQVTEVHVAPAAPTTAFDDDFAMHQNWQTILTVVRNSSIVIVALCGCVIAWTVFRRRVKSAPTASADAAPENLKQITEEMDRNPEILAKVLSRWLERSEASDRIAA